MVTGEHLPPKQALSESWASTDHTLAESLFSSVVDVFSHKQLAAARRREERTSIV